MPEQRYYLRTCFRSKREDGTVVVADPVTAQYTDIRKGESAFYSKVGSSIAEPSIIQFSVTLCDEMQNELLKKSWTEDDVV